MANTLGSRILLVYLTIRAPRNFIKLLGLYIVTSLTAHFGFGYDGDLGLTNLMLSIEASTAGAVLMVVAEESARTSAQMLAAVLELVGDVKRIGAAILVIAEVLRDHAAEQGALLKVVDGKVSLLLQSSARLHGEEDGRDDAGGPVRDCTRQSYGVDPVPE